MVRSDDPMEAGWRQRLSGLRAASTAAQGELALGDAAAEENGGARPADQRGLRPGR